MAASIHTIRCAREYGAAIADESFAARHVEAVRVRSEIIAHGEPA